MTSWQGAFLEDIANELKNIREILEKQSTTEQSSKVGEWIHVDDKVRGYFQCSLCGKYARPTITIRDKETGRLSEKGASRFCPNCGARMKEADK